ncbi:MAG: hypothetical protein AAFP70_08385 [Calditrichota bacterium]
MALRYLLPAILFAFMILTSSINAQENDIPRVQSGSIELAFHGSFDYARGSRDLTAALRGSYFFKLGKPLFSAGLESAVSNSRSFTRFDNRLLFGIHKPFTNSAVMFQFALTGGTRQEKLGSFWLNRYSLGLLPGFRFLITNRTAIFTEYHLQRVFNDPTQNFTDQRIQIGLSIFFRNK